MRLDRYDAESADEESLDGIDRDMRLVAEAQMCRRDKEAGRALGAFVDGDDELMLDGDHGGARMHVRRRRRDTSGFDDLMDLDEGEGVSCGYLSVLSVLCT